MNVFPFFTISQVRCDVLLNCGKALLTNAAVLKIEKAVAHSIYRFLGDDQNQSSVHPSFCVGFLHGLPLQVALLTVKGLKSLWKWTSTLAKYRYIMSQTRDPEERHFYIENWMKVFSCTSVELVKSIGTQLLVGLISLTLEGIGMAISHFLFPDVEFSFSGRDLVCAFNLLAY